MQAASHGHFANFDEAASDGHFGDFEEAASDGQFADFEEAPPAAISHSLEDREGDASVSVSRATHREQAPHVGGEEGHDLSTLDNAAFRTAVMQLMQSMLGGKARAG